tara:strand:+ start:1583 stop:4819 length:3237 start_codon:yes stop_codon:yes gene_type:complete
MVIKIPLDGGLVTQVDPDEVGANACTALSNVEFDKSGILYKRNGFTTGVNIHPEGLDRSTGSYSWWFTNDMVWLKSVKRFYNPNLTSKYVWVATYVHKKSYGSNEFYISFWYSTNGTSWTIINERTASSYNSSTTDIPLSETDYSNDNYRVDIKDFNSQIRFVLGRTNEPRLWTYIDRKFFWTSEEMSNIPGFYIDTARPRDIIKNYIEGTNLEISDPSTENHWFHETGVGSLNLATTYYYKYSLIFDGVQETNLSGLLEDTSLSSLDNRIPKIKVFIDPGSSLSNWNPRVTGLNLYRSTNVNGPYSKIIPVSTKAEDPQITTVDDAYYDATKIFVDGEVYTENELVGKYIICQGFSAKIVANTDNSITIEDKFRDWVAYNNINVGDAVSTHLAQVNYPLCFEGPLCWNKRSIPYESNYQIAEDVNHWVWSNQGPHTMNSNSHGYLEPYYANNPGGSVDTYTSGLPDIFQGIDRNHRIVISPDGTYEGWKTNGTMQDLNGNPLDIVEGATYHYEGWHKFPAGDGADRGRLLLQFPSGILYFHIGSDTIEGTTVLRETFPDGTVRDHFDTDADLHSSSYNHHEWHKFELEWVATENTTLTKLYFIGTIAIGTGTGVCFVGPQQFYRKADKTASRGYAGKDVIFSDSLRLGSFDSHKGFIYQKGSGGLQNDEYGYIKANSQRAIKVGDDDTFPYNLERISTPRKLIINRNYLWQKDNNNNQVLTYFDKGEANGTQHPFEEVSTQTKYSYSKFINGRNFVANVEITNGEEIETHENWVIYSELNQPDNLPITNYIQIADSQGGAIVGLENLLGDLVVFMERGIYRLSIPSVDPTGWSLSESEENIGCISPESITKWEAGVFFAGKDHLYFLDANFQAQPMTRAIKDLYQNYADASVVAYDGIKTSYDPKKNKLFLYNIGTSKLPYCLDLSVFPKERWSYQHHFYTYNRPKIITIDEDLKVYQIGDFQSDNYRRMRTQEGTATESTLMDRRTGWISGPDLGKRIHVRRLNLKYKSSDDITVRFYVDGDDSTIIRTLTIPADTLGQDWYRCAPGVRGRQFMIRMTTGYSTDDVEIRRLEVEFE